MWFALSMPRLSRKDHSYNLKLPTHRTRKCDTSGTWTKWMCLVYFADWCGMQKLSLSIHDETSGERQINRWVCIIWSLQKAVVQGTSSILAPDKADCWSCLLARINRVAPARRSSFKRLCSSNLQSSNRQTSALSTTQIMASVCSK